MTATVLIRGDVPNSYQKKSGERVHERLLTVLDVSGDSQVPDTFEVLDPELASNLPSLIGKQATLFVKSFMPRQSGVRIIGTITVAAGK